MTSCEFYGRFREFPRKHESLSRIIDGVRERLNRSVDDTDDYSEDDLC